MKPKCYTCKYREDLVYDAHSCCTNNKSIKELNIKANQHGISRGWFMWPSNFDPVWLENCDGYKEK